MMIMKPLNIAIQGNVLWSSHYIENYIKRYRNQGDDGLFVISLTAKSQRKMIELKKKIKKVNIQKKIFHYYRRKYFII